MSLATRLNLLAFAESEDIYLVEDGAYSFTGAPPRDLPSLKALDRTRRVIHIGTTFSKICMAGARVGYVIADQAVAGPGQRPIWLADALGRIKSMVSVNTSPIGQGIAGGMLLRHGASIRSLGAEKAALYRLNLKAPVEALEQRFRPLAERYPGIRWTQPCGGFFARLRLPFSIDIALLERSAAEFGVLWTPMSTFYLDPGGGSHELRLSCSYLSPAAIGEGVRRLAAFAEAICAETSSL